MEAAGGPRLGKGKSRLETEEEKAPEGEIVKEELTEPKKTETGPENRRHFEQLHGKSLFPRKTQRSRREGQHLGGIGWGALQLATRPNREKAQVPGTHCRGKREEWRHFHLYHAAAGRHP